MESKPAKSSQPEPPVTVGPPSPPARAEPPDAVSFATMSAVIPGVGQWAQGRRLIGALQFGTVAAYVVTSIVTGNEQAAWLGVAWNVWSAVDAFRYARRDDRWREEGPPVSSDR